MPQELYSDTSLDKVLDSIFNGSTTENYPAYNVYTMGNDMYIEIAATGFSKKDIHVYIENNILHVSAKKEQVQLERKYEVHKIAVRNFIRKFKLLIDIEDIEVTLENGILRLKLIKSATEEKRNFSIK